MSVAGLLWVACHCLRLSAPSACSCLLGLGLLSTRLSAVCCLPVCLGCSLLFRVHRLRLPVCWACLPVSVCLPALSACLLNLSGFVYCLFTLGCPPACHTILSAWVVCYCLLGSSVWVVCLGCSVRLGCLLFTPAPSVCLLSGLLLFRSWAGFACLRSVTRFFWVAGSVWANLVAGSGSGLNLLRLLSVCLAGLSGLLAGSKVKVGFVCCLSSVCWAPRLHLRWVACLGLPPVSVHCSSAVCQSRLSVCPSGLGWGWAGFTIWVAGFVCLGCCWAGSVHQLSWVSCLGLLGSSACLGWVWAVCWVRLLLSARWVQCLPVCLGLSATCCSPACHRCSVHLSVCLPGLSAVCSSTPRARKKMTA